MPNQIAYGFVDHEHLFTSRVTDSNIGVVRDAIEMSVAEHNRQVEAVMTELAEPTVQYSTVFKGLGGGTLQPLDEKGVPRPIKGLSSYDVAFPIRGGGTSWGDTRVTRALMTVQEVNDYTVDAMLRDGDWLKRHAMGAMLDNTTWAYNDPEHGTLTIQPLANGDSVQYARTSGVFATDNHYLAQANAIDNSNNPFPTIYKELTEHADNRGAIIVSYIPENQVAAAEALAGFVEYGDPDIEQAIASDRLRGSIDRGVGDEVLGKVDKVWVVRWDALPDDYIISVARGTSKSVLRMRQYDAPALQGFFTEEHSSNGNFAEHRFIRYAGFGAFNRTGACVMRIGNASYAIPSGYNTPLPV